MNEFGKLPLAMAAALASETEGEHTCWIEQPNSVDVYKANAWNFIVIGFFIVISFYCLAVLSSAAIFGTPIPAWLTTSGPGETDVLFISLIIFVSGGLCLVAKGSRDYRGADHTVYAITDQRLIILTVGSGTTIQSIMPNAMDVLTISKRSNDTGNLKVTLGYSSGSEGRRVEHQMTLFGVPNVQHAEQLLRELRQKTKI